MSFWDIIWFIIVSFAFIAYLIVMFQIVMDIFRDRSTSGFVKAMWIALLIFLPFLTALAYLIFRGRGMGERQMASARAMQTAQDDYIRSVAAASPTDEIARAKGLLDSGAISQAEYDALKAKALG